MKAILDSLVGRGVVFQPAPGQYSRGDHPDNPRRPDLSSALSPSRVRGQRQGGLQLLPSSNDLAGLRLLAGAGSTAAQLGSPALVAVTQGEHWAAWLAAAE